MFITNFLLYLMGHSLADTSLQPDSMSRGKSRHNPINPDKVPVGQKPMKLWYMWITHHALIQGFTVIGITYFLTGNKELSILFGIIETISHWIIDFFKCESKYDPRVDQLLHIGIKVLFCIILN